MRQSSRHLGAFLIAAGMLGAVLSAAPSSAQNPTPQNPPPEIPLLENEHYLALPGSCGGMIYTMDASKFPAADIAASEKLMAARVWSGGCRNGLIHGFGNLEAPDRRADQLKYNITGQSEFILGRALSKFTMTAPDEGVVATTLSYNTPIGTAQINANPDLSPFWDKRLTMFLVSEGGKHQMAQLKAWSCFVDVERFKGCSDYLVYRIEIGGLDGKPNEVFYCPNPRSRKGCDALWQEKSAPVVARVRQIIAVAAENDKTLRAKLAAFEDPAFLSAFRMQKAAERQAAAAERADRQAVALKAEADAKIEVEKERVAAVAAKEKADLEAAALKEKEDRELKAKRAAMNAGQLFAEADELKAAGKTQDAREVLRIMISRFPDHPLSVTAAQQMATMK